MSEKSSAIAAQPKTVQIVCPSCSGEGHRQVTHEMAVDAGDRQLEGTDWGCSNCNGDGWILQEIETGYGNCSQCGWGLTPFSGTCTNANCDTRKGEF